MPDAMADNQSDGPDPLRLKFQQAFGFSVDATALTASMQQTVDTAQQVNNALRGRLNQVMMQQLAESAVHTDGLKMRIGNGLQAQVAQSQVALQKLQQPIFTNLVSDLGTTLEATAPFGVTAPQQGEEVPCPACVVIRSSAQAGDLGPALECYRARALPLRDSHGMDYARAVDFIQKCLPPDDSIQGMFSSAVLAIQNEPFTQVGGLGINVRPAGGVASIPPTVTMVPPGVLPAVPGQLSQVGLGPPPGGPAGNVTVDGGGVIVGELPCTGGPPNDNPPNFEYACVNGQWTLLPLAGAPAGLGWTGTSGGVGLGPPPFPGGGGGPFVPLFPYTGGPTTCDALSAITPAEMDTLRAGGKVNKLDLLGPNSATLFWGQVNDPNVFPPRIVITTSVPHNVGPGWHVVGQAFCPFPPQSTTTTPPPPPPPPPNCPPPPCIPICATTKPECPPPPPKTKYNAWCTKSGILYILRDDQPPRNDDDSKVASGTPDEWNIAALVKQCRGQETESEYVAEKPGGIQVGQVQIAGCGEFGSIPTAAVPAGAVTLAQWLGIARPDGSVAVPFPDAGTTDLGQNFVNALIGAVGTPVVGYLDALNAVMAGSPCASGQQLGLMITQALLNIGRTVFGDALDQLTIPNTQQRNFACPVRLPGIGEASSAYLSNNIDAATLECWVRAAGGRFPEFWRAIEGSRSKLSSGEYATLRRRHVLTEGEYREKMREAGFLRDDDVDALYQLTQQIPPPTDLVRFMVRDAGDDTLVKRFRLDDQFEDKFTEQIQIWATQQGVSDDYMRYVWRSHWSIPAPGQLANMLHRLSRRQPGDPAFVDTDTIRAALVQQDIAPFWIDKFIAISYAPLTRIDARRAYEIGAMSKAGLKEAYLNLGYSPESADTLVDFNVKNTERTFLRRPEVAQLANGELNEYDFDLAMQQWGAPPEALVAAKQRASIIRRGKRRKACLTAIRKRFLKGEFGQQEAIAKAQAQGLELETATELAAGWQCEADALGKEFTFGQLNQLYEAGIINEVEYVQRAVRLHYDNDEAVKLLRLTQRRLGIKATKMQADQLVKEQQQQQRLAKALMQQANRDESQRAKNAAALAKARGVGVLREKRLIAAAVKFARSSGIPVEDAIPQVKSLVRSALDNHATTWDEVIGDLTAIVADDQVDTLPKLVSALAVALAAPASSDLTTLP